MSNDRELFSKIVELWNKSCRDKSTESWAEREYWEHYFGVPHENLLADDQDPADQPVEHQLGVHVPVLEIDQIECVPHQ